MASALRNGGGIGGIGGCADDGDNGGDPDGNGNGDGADPAGGPAARCESRRAVSSWHGRRIDVQVTQRQRYDGSHIVVEVAGDGQGHRPQWAEYITDDAEFDSAFRAGFEIARQLMG